MFLEYQRYGRNKGTLVNSNYINGGEYRNKFDKITDNKDLNRVLYTKAKEILKHRSGTKFEDMYWIDGKSGEVVASALDERAESAVFYSNSIAKVILHRQHLVVLHNHPNSMPPSAADFNSMHLHRYEIAIVVCHDGKIFQYIANEVINERLYFLYIQDYISRGGTEFEAQWKALEKLKKNNNIDFWEVLS